MSIAYLYIYIYDDIKSTNVYNTYGNALVLIFIINLYIKTNIPQRIKSLSVERRGACFSQSFFFPTVKLKKSMKSKDDKCALALHGKPFKGA